MKRMVLAGLVMLTAGALAGSAAAADMGRPYQPALRQSPDLQSGLHLDRLLPRPQWRRRLGSLELGSHRQPGFVRRRHRRHRRLQLADRPGGVRHRERCRLVGRERDDRHDLRGRLRHRKRLARHRSGPASAIRSTGSCPTSPAAWRRATSRPPPPASPEPPRPTWAGPSGPASRSRSSAIGRRRPNISTSTSATSTAGSPAAWPPPTTCRSRPTWCAAASTTSSEHSARMVGTSVPNPSPFRQGNRGGGARVGPLHEGGISARREAQLVERPPTRRAPTSPRTGERWRMRRRPDRPPLG